MKHLIRVHGLPAPQGSKRAFVSKSTGRAITVESSGDKLKQWRASVSKAAGEHAAEWADEGTFPCVMTPICLTLSFELPRPKAHYRKDGSVKESFARLPHLVKPDCDKLARAVLDACAGILWQDDSQVTTLIVKKRYGTSPGCLIDVETA